MYTRVRADGDTPAGNWYECGEVAAAHEQGQKIDEAVWEARKYIFEYSTWQFPALLAKKRFLEPGRAVSGGYEIAAVERPVGGGSGLEIAFYPWGGALKKTNPRMTKG